MKPTSPLVLTALLSVAAAVPAPESTTPTSCDADCLLKLIRYREEVNVDWLMAVGYCSFMLDSPAARFQLQTADAATALSSVLPIDTDPDITITTTVTTTATTSTTTTVKDLQRRLDDTPARCEKYRARERPQPSPWNGHSEPEIREACSRILHRTLAAAPPMRTAFVRPVALSMSPVVVGDATEFVTLTVYTTITAGAGPWPVTPFVGEAVKTIVRTEMPGDGGVGREFSCDGAFAECCRGTGTSLDGALEGVGCDDNPDSGPAVCGAENQVALCCSVVFLGIDVENRAFQCYSPTRFVVAPTAAS
ncbi:hypothetical protein QBC34DRAFT_433853 [Podospora aff. communis PSN243]|uniref:Hydrophobin n=1 Tax=Podospora aff. communis PSN243 TaxID=3040156 RepID=A0AAV9H0H5_9PEZI|nr:hypothetical protein QBC34DRAFT_433853 [Podospora aff. communis PSN243]